MDAMAGYLYQQSGEQKSNFVSFLGYFIPDPKRGFYKTLFGPTAMANENCSSRYTKFVLYRDLCLLMPPVGIVK
jgi:hypothetical protein